ncbi:hypothetical protein FQR65_LT12439 [Abscondita terminalis]|nr:hypothetical protein FQR65_LT12439 [Abscondita terminalis]
MVTICAVNVSIREIKESVEEIDGHMPKNLPQPLKAKSAAFGKLISRDWQRKIATLRRDIVTKRDSTPNHSDLYKYFHLTDLSQNEDVVRGITLKPVAREMYPSLINVPVRECRIFISPEEGILCASPDGVVEKDEDEIIEIKCPRVPPNEVPNHDNFLISDKDTEELILNKKRRY